VSEELDDPQVLRRLAKRLALSTLGGLAAAAAGTAIALAIYRPVVGALSLEFFKGWGAFLWLELGALISAVIGFTICWRRLKS
jgi:hypothetical protein